MAYPINRLFQTFGLILVLSLWLAAVSGCKKGDDQKTAAATSSKQDAAASPNPGAPSNHTTMPAAAQPTGAQAPQLSTSPTTASAPIELSLKQGGEAYVRIKTFDAEKNGQTLKFADKVKLDDERAGPPIYWSVSDGKGGPKSWIPAYLLTPSLAEIDMLRTRNRIPESMTFFYEQIIDGRSQTRQHGRVHLPGTPIIATLTAGGVSVTDQGSAQVAFRGNAVIFDASVLKQPAWVYPIVFSDGTRSLPMAAGKIFYCTDEEGAGKFDCLELPWMDAGSNDLPAK